MAEVVSIAKSREEPATRPGFVMTNTAKDIYRSLRMMEKLPGFRIGLICGAPGVDKTRTLDALRLIPFSSVAPYVDAAHNLALVA